jgi:hypothetical protein
MLRVAKELAEQHESFAARSRFNHATLPTEIGHSWSSVCCAALDEFPVALSVFLFVDLTFDDSRGQSVVSNARTQNLIKLVVRLLKSTRSRATHALLSRSCLSNSGLKSDRSAQKTEQPFFAHRPLNVSDCEV